MIDRLVKKKRPILFSIVFLVIGFIIAFSYRTIGKTATEEQMQSNTLAAEEAYREDLIRQQERNRELFEEINGKQEQISGYEQSFLNEEEEHADLVEEARDLRLLIGDVPAQGQGLRVTLEDAEYDPVEQNPNDYIVHESHVFNVINELKIAGAQGISINGQRITHNSYIKCTGPVITIDGNTYPAPFVVEAVGNMDHLHEALYLKGGVIDHLLLDNIVVNTEQVKSLKLSAVSEEGNS